MTTTEEMIEVAAKRWRELEEIPQYDARSLREIMVRAWNLAMEQHFITREELR